MPKNPNGRIEIDGKWYRLNKNGKPGVELVRCSNTMTEAEFLGWVLSALRTLTKRWKPASDAWKIDVRSNQNTDYPRLKNEHKCVKCDKWFPKQEKIKGTRKIRYPIGIELDHIIPIGGMNHLDKVPAWITKALVEVNGYQKLCTICHTEKTKEEKRK